MSNERKRTVRQDMIRRLEKSRLTVPDLSKAVGVTEKEVCHHLAYIQKSLKPQKRQIRQEPYTCLHCGFAFRKRERFKKPGRCPVCRQGRIAWAVLRIE